MIALLLADVQEQSFRLNVADVPYYQIKTGKEELEGVYRYTDEHTYQKKVKKSLYYVVYFQKGQEKEVVPIEISFNVSTKAAMMGIKASADSKLQRT